MATITKNKKNISQIDPSTFTPITTTPVRYEIINIVSTFSQIKEDVPNIMKIMPIKNSSVLRISKTTPYTITAIFIEANNEITSHEIKLIFFAGNQSWWNKIFLLNTIITISGKPKPFSDKLSIIHPSKLGNATIFQQKFSSQSSQIIIPHYRQKTEDNTLQEYLVKEISEKIKKNNYTQFANIYQKINPNLNINSALINIHQPNTLEAIEEAKKFLACFEYISYKHTIQKINQHKAQFFDFKKNFIPQLHQSLKFPLTEGQTQAIQKIMEFQKSQNGKLFLLQGDVGCGKTIVAISCAINIVKSGFQVAVLAPTQILATQLYNTFYETLSSFEISCTLLTSKEKAKEKKIKLSEIQNGKTNIIIGTHAIFSQSVEFCNLGFVIIDEQHKFGVRQRLELMKKSQNAKCLTMTATPIPRTLSMSMYSGIEFFAITEKPQNRLPIITTLLSSAKSEELISSTKKKFSDELKMYWVCPLIESESEMKANIKQREVFLKKFFKQEEIAVVHGQMKEDEISNAIMEFKENKKVKVLLATTIIEVGIDIPSANIIVIESAETFGLASLHQLRGRVGRSSKQGYCILLFNTESEISQKAKERLQAMKDSNDGFFIAQMDKKIRGSGNILGDAQSGTMKFTFFDEELHQDLFLQFEQVFLSATNQEREEISQIFHNSINLEYSQQ